MFNSVKRCKYLKHSSQQVCASQCQASCQGGDKRDKSLRLETAWEMKDLVRQA